MKNSKKGGSNDMSINDTCGWTEQTGQWQQYPKLSNEQLADWVVIGAGFTGIAAARRIAELDPGKRVMLIDGKQPGQGASARNSGFAVAYESPGHAQIQTKAGREGYMARHTIDSAGVAEVERLVNEHQIACDWSRTGSIHAAADPKNFDAINKHQMCFADMGIESSLLNQQQLMSRLGTDHYGLGVYCEGGALLQPAALVKGLLESLPKQIEVYAESPVTNIEPGPMSGLQNRFPWPAVDAIESTWSGQICISRNSRPVLGEHKKMYSHPVAIPLRA
jgi:glycine/D-amino acid oxidase-like deaminating enzyme